jgi:UDP-3-O-[3-hydroxymyristoyl] glucosamine N-acyltransferase
MEQGTGLRFTILEIAEHIGGRLAGDPERVITGAASLRQAEVGDIVFAEGQKYAEELQSSKAGAAILAEGLEAPAGMCVVRFSQPALGMAMVLDLLFPRRRTFNDVSPRAFIGKHVEIGEDVGIGPGASIGDHARIGRGTEIHPNATIGRETVIGEDCVIHAGAHIYPRTAIGDRVVIHSGAVIGADGFGFVQEKLPPEKRSAEEPVRHRKVPQIGRVVIEDDVEIGANTTIDRAALETTRVARGTKIDNLVMIGHNCRVGRHCIIVAQAGVSGSTELGDYVTIAGQAGLAGHLVVGARAIVGAQAGVTKSIPQAQVVLGSPAMEIHKARRALALIESLPEFKKELAAIQKRLEEIEARIGKTGG